MAFKQYTEEEFAGDIATSGEPLEGDLPDDPWRTFLEAPEARMRRRAVAALRTSARAGQFPDKEEEISRAREEHLKAVFDPRWLALDVSGMMIPGSIPGMAMQIEKAEAGGRLERYMRARANSSKFRRMLQDIRGFLKHGSPTETRLPTLSREIVPMNAMVGAEGVEGPMRLGSWEALEHFEEQYGGMFADEYSELMDLHQRIPEFHYDQAVDEIKFGYKPKHLGGVEAETAGASYGQDDKMVWMRTKGSPLMKQQGQRVEPAKFFSHEVVGHGSSNIMFEKAWEHIDREGRTLSPETMDEMQQILGKGQANWEELSPRSREMITKLANQAQDLTAKFPSLKEVMTWQKEASHKMQALQYAMYDFAKFRNDLINEALTQIAENGGPQAQRALETMSAQDIIKALETQSPMYKQLGDDFRNSVRLMNQLYHHMPEEVWGRAVDDAFRKKGMSYREAVQYGASRVKARAKASQMILEKGEDFLINIMQGRYGYPIE